MAEESRRGLGPAEILLVAVAVCVMVAIGIATASAFTQGADVPSSSPEPLPTAPTTLVPAAPTAEPAAPVASTGRVSAQWVADTAARTGIGEVAVQAYGSAALRLEDEQPACHVGWTTLAGVGGIESGHGTNGGSTLLADGRTSVPIIGPALDGTDGTAPIRSTSESVQWHGDPRWDHAIGPMQFIPSTWDRWRSDGNGDGVDDPGNVVDAAYAAGRYLCASGADLRTGTGWTRAIFSYNHSDDYVRSVLAFANAYATR